MTEMQQAVPAAQPQQVQAPVENVDKLLPQSTVNDLVVDAKQKSFQKGYSQALAELQAQQQPQPAAQQSNAPADDLRKLVADEFTKQQQVAQQQMLKQQQEAEGKRILDELNAKVTAAAPKYSDYDEVTKQVDFRQIPEVLHYANLVDNAGDVLYDLAKNPGKIATLRGLPPALAKQEMLRMSASIKQNQDAQQQAAPRDPLNQIKPSNIDIGKGPQTPADYRNSFKGKY